MQNHTHTHPPPPKKTPKTQPPKVPPNHSHQKPKPCVTGKIFGAQCDHCILSVRCCSLCSTADHVSTQANSVSCCSLPAAGCSWSPYCWALQACCYVCCGMPRFLGLWVLGVSLFLSDAFRSVKGSARIGPNCSFVLSVFSF